MMKKLPLATVVGAVVQFLLGWLVYGVILAGFMESHTHHFEGLMKDMNTASFMILIFCSGLVMSFLIASIFQRWAKIKTFVDGFVGGLWFGFLFALSMDLYYLAAMNLMSKKGLLVDIICSTIITGIVGGIIGWILGMGKKQEPVVK
jgi:hypothetical protein